MSSMSFGRRLSGSVLFVVDLVLILYSPGAFGIFIWWANDQQKFVYALLAFLFAVRAFKEDGADSPPIVRNRNASIAQMFGAAGAVETRKVHYSPDNH
jgi:hypothetical protein